LLRVLSRDATLGDDLALNDALGLLLCGRLNRDSRDDSDTLRLSDSGFIKLFRLLRLARRLSDMEAGSDEAGH
jgi:hypothetical protein